MSGIDYYRILGVPPSATKRAIRDAYLAQVRRLHPDRVGSEGTERFQQVTEAYEHLSDPAKRRSYDRATGSAPMRPSDDIVDLGRGAGAEPLVPEPRTAPRNAPQPPVLTELEVLLTPMEASRGVILPLVVPAVTDCRWCGGRSGLVYPCRRCGGSGIVTEEQVIGIRIPAGIPDGSVLDLPLSREFGGSIDLRIYVRVQGETVMSSPHRGRAR